MIRSPKYSTNDLKRLALETRAIMEIANEDDLSFARESDENLETPIYQYLQQIGLNVSFEEYLEILKELDYFFEEIHKEKEKWGIDRPFKTALKYNIPFKRKFISQTAHSSSYPSGHAAGSRYLVHLISKKYRNVLTEEQIYNLYLIANQIAWGRIQIGVHTTQDIRAGKEFADGFFESRKALIR